MESRTLARQTRDKLFEQSCEMGLFRLSADKVAKIFGVRVTKRLRGKLYGVLKSSTIAIT
jgi:hypothetical protein